MNVSANSMEQHPSSDHSFSSSKAPALLTTAQLSHPLWAT